MLPAHWNLRMLALQPGKTVEALPVLRSGDRMSVLRLTTLPTLGLDWVNSGGGFGAAKPGLVSMGGDPTGVVSSVTWQSWGGLEASGTGTSDYVTGNESVADGSQEKVTIVALDLGLCGGHPAYQGVVWYFPGEGQRFDPSEVGTTCTAP
jgi:hypothetical protein